MPRTEHHERAAASARSIFSHLLVGVDGTEQSFEACRQAARLADADTLIDAAAVVHLAPAVAAAADPAHVADQLQREAEAALEQAARILGKRAHKRFLDGFVTPALIGEIERSGASLLVLGTHGHRRMTEILIGGVAGELLHKAPCSVLIARPAAAIDAFPRSLVVGLDGSAQADQALAVAQQLEARFDSRLRVITALKGKDVDLRHVHLRTPFSQAVDQQPVKALVAASDDADLVVVGSRGLHGLRALGSVSERVAHRAACSVLVVRVPARVRRSTFAPAEWELLCQAPTYAGLIVAAAQRGGFFWEALSIAQTFAEVRAHQGQNPLLDDICAERPLVEHTRFRSAEELRAHGLEHIRAALELLERKGEPADVNVYSRFLTEIAEHVARAYLETDEPVTDAEEEAIAAVKAAASATQT